MSLQTLPQEVLETLLLYVKVEDFFTVCNVINFKGSDLFWRRLCEREHVTGKLHATEGSSYRTVFYRYINWVKQKFIKREYTFYVSDDKTHRHLFGENLIIQNSSGELSVWNIDKCPVLKDTLEGQILTESKGKMLVRNKQGKLNVYLCIYNLCYKHPTFEFDHSSNSQYALSDQYFAECQSSRSRTTVFNFETGSSSTFHYKFNTSPLICSYSLTYFNIIGNIVYLIFRNIRETNFVSKRFHLDEWHFLDDISFIDRIYTVSYNCHGSNYLFVIRSSEPSMLFKVWNSNGEFIKTLSLKLINKYARDCNVQWFIVEGKYIIFSTEDSNIYIWCTNDPETLQYLAKSKHSYVGHDVLSSNLLVLSYKHCFKVVDFTRATYLYEIPFDDGDVSDSLKKYLLLESYQGYLVNKYYYLIFKEKRKPFDKCGHSRFESKGSREDVTCTLTIYDFRR